METYTETVGNKLNDLLEKNYDAEKGFKKAAENIENENLKNFFNRKASEKYDFGHELKNEIKFFNQEVDKGASAISELHRAWMDIRSILSLNDEKAMLEEVKRGEETAVQEYEDILKDINLPISTKNILKKQKDHLEKELNSIEIIEESFSH